MRYEDPYDLRRFVLAQDPVFEAVLAELRAGRKRTHWMWFVFPQLRELGRSPTAKLYGIGSLAEARAYLAHPVLEARLRAATGAVLDSGEASLHAIFGSPDDWKFHASMTLFAAAAKDPALFRLALARYCAGEPHPATMAFLDAS